MDCARNIVTANFSGGGTSATTAPLWQWDYGQALCITGIDLPAAFEVHFSTNRTGGVSTVAVGADGQVTIPNVLLTIGKNLNAWIYLSDARGEGETEYSILIPVKARPMPETYDAEVTGEFDDVVRQVSEYAQTAQTAADNARASATAAAASADSAAASASAAETAKTAAETAQGKAEDAQTAAETAAQTATEKAQQSAQDAAQAALDAGRAESAAGSAEAAQTGAESAKTDAETAAQGAADSASAASASSTSAGQAATSAAQSATAAAGSATTAGNAAQTATDKAGEASASASAAAASETAAQTAQTAAETAASTATASVTTATTKAAEAAQSASNAAASETAAEAAATRAETAAASLTVDSALSDTSVNPVQNKVITGAITDVKSHLEAISDDSYETRPMTVYQASTGWRLNESDGLCSQNSAYKLVKYAVVPGDLIKVISDDRFQFQSSASVPSTGTSNRVGMTYGSITTYIVVPTGATYLVFSTPTANSVAAAYSCIDKNFKTIPPSIEFIDGFGVNYSNGNLLADTSYEYAKIDVSLFQGGNITGTTAAFPNGLVGVAFKDDYDDYIVGYRNTTPNVYKWNYDLQIPTNAKYFYLSLRKASESDYVVPTFPWDVVFGNVQQIQNDAKNSITAEKITGHQLDNARHIKGNAHTPLTLLHFSDLHADHRALARICSDGVGFGANIDDMICTGDMVANTSGQIASWWDASVLTCIGNHETASYSASTGYDWTALSMADRDAYYIAPFESGWGITHTSGTSYYYKDYTAQKVRLIVMDAMLYTGTPGAEAIAQTAWLANLLSDAITNSYHVLIAIHSPHGGATAKVCSFSKYGQGTMPTYSDCNTPQTVIDTVAIAIGNGLHFIGYIVGHTHQDNIWDAEGDGKQLMYCVTCAAVYDENQWKNSDQYRGVNADAYNLVTIDTTNTLVKIVRGGGADIDDHMRTRKAICFNYTTGTVVGEVL